MIHKFILDRCVQCNLPLEELESVGWECPGHAESTSETVPSPPLPEKSREPHSNEESCLGVNDAVTVSQAPTMPVQQVQAEPKQVYCLKCRKAVHPDIARANLGFCRACCTYRRPISLSGISVVLVAFIVIVAVITAIVDKPELEIDGQTGKLRKTYTYTWSIDNAGRDIALSVWNAADKHREINQIIVSVYLSPVLLSDKYGKELKDSMLMGEIPVDDLNEVRRYTSEGSYSVSNKAIYAALMQNMDHANQFEH